MKVNKILGIVLFLIGGFLIFNSFSSMTGFAVAEFVGKGASSILGFVFVLVGVLVFMAGGKQKEGNLAKQILKDGGVILDSRKLRRISKKVEKQEGYSGREVKEGYQILDRDENPLTVIPNHDVSAGVYRSIMNSLATGESSFRKRTGYLDN